MTDIVWSKPQSGDWGEALNWQPQIVPDSDTTQVKITAPGSYGVSIDEFSNSSTGMLGNSFTAGSVLLDAAGAYLSVGGTLDLPANGRIVLDAGQLELNSFEGGALIQGGTLAMAGGKFDVDDGGGTLSGVTIDGPLVLDYSNPQDEFYNTRLSLLNGVQLYGADGTSPGLLAIEGFNSLVQFGDATLNHVTIQLGAPNDPDAAFGFQGISGGTLSIGTDATINQVAGIGTIEADILVNDGTINVRTEATIDSSSAPFRNAGSVDISGTASIDGPFISTGLIELSSGGTLLIGNQAYPYPVTQYADTGTIQLDGGVIQALHPVSLSGTVALVSGTSDQIGGPPVSAADFVDGDTTLSRAPIIQDDGAIAFASDTTLLLDSGFSQQTATGQTGVITGFDPSDVLDLQVVPEVFDTARYADGTLTLSQSDGAATETLFVTGDYAADAFDASSDGAGGTDVTLRGTEVPCFARGTRLLTMRGEVPVETLQVGDVMVTFLGEGATLKPVRWIGHRLVDCRRHPRPRNVWPVRIAAGAFGSGVPHRDLRLSPGHAVAWDTVLIPAIVAVNGATVTQAPVDRVEYFHVELEAHDLLLAEGLRVESYLDTGNRSAFQTEANVSLHGALDPSARRHGTCLPVAEGGPAVVALTRHLHARASTLGFTRSVGHTMRLLAGERGLPFTDDGRTFLFMLPAMVDDLRLVSSVFHPCATSAANADWRRLGVRVEAIAVELLDGWRTIPLDDPALGDGFHHVEMDQGEPFLWTDGCATLPAGLLRGARRLKLRMGTGSSCWTREPEALRTCNNDSAA